MNTAVEALKTKLPVRQEFNALQAIEERNETAATAVAAQAKAMVEARYVMALKRPRNWDQVRQDLIKECHRPSFAANKSAFYKKPIGAGVEGLGIRFVEVALRCMTNVMVESQMVYEDVSKEIHRVTVTDLEANLTYPLDVTVKRTVERAKPMDDGSYIAVRMNSSGKPSYTVSANDDDLLNKRGALISKAVRTLGLRIIPGDLQDEAEDIIKAVRLDAAAKDPDAERKKISDAFGALNVKVADLEEYLDHKLDACTPAELVDLRGLYGALRDGEATWKSAMENKRAQQAEPPADKSAKPKGVAAVKAEINKQTGEIDPDPTNAIPGASGEPPKVEYEALLTRIQNATIIEYLDDQESLIGAIEGQDRQNTLIKASKKRREELTEAAAKKK